MPKRWMLEGSNSCEDFEWQDLCDQLTALMNKINPNAYWKARVEGFGWMSRDGSKDTFIARDGKDLLISILPKTECHFKIYRHGKTGIKINNSHHDKPMGGEIYIITAVKGIK